MAQRHVRGTPQQSTGTEDVLPYPGEITRSAQRRGAGTGDTPADGAAPGPPAAETARRAGVARRCTWCRRVLPTTGSVGRPRLYCGQACRQRAYEQRATTTRAGVPDDVVLIGRGELDSLQDRLYQLRCALEDVQTLLGQRPTKVELESCLADLVRATGRLDRLWVTGRPR